MTDQAAPAAPTIPTPTGGVPVAPQAPSPIPPIQEPPKPPAALVGDLIASYGTTLSSPTDGAEAILEKLASSGLKKSAFVAFAVMAVQTLLGGFLAQRGITNATVTTDAGYAFDGGTVIYIVVSKWHDIQAGKIAAVVKQAAQAVQQGDKP